MIENIIFVGNYYGIIDDMLVISTPDVAKGTGLIIDFSTIYCEEVIISIGTRKPNLVAFVNIEEIGL